VRHAAAACAAQQQRAPWQFQLWYATLGLHHVTPRCSTGRSAACPSHTHPAPARPTFCGRAGPPSTRARVRRAILDSAAGALDGGGGGGGRAQRRRAGRRHETAASFQRAPAARRSSGVSRRRRPVTRAHSPSPSAPTRHRRCSCQHQPPPTAPPHPQRAPSVSGGP
jgi:hypothetical protein